MAKRKIKFDDEGNRITNPAGRGLSRLVNELYIAKTGVKRDSERNPKSPNANDTPLGNRTSHASVAPTNSHGASNGSSKRQKTGAGFQPRNSLTSGANGKETGWSKGLTAKPGIKARNPSFNSAPAFESSSSKAERIDTDSPKPAVSKLDLNKPDATSKSELDSSPDTMELDSSNPIPVFKNFKQSNNKALSKSDAPKPSNSDLPSKKIDLSNKSASGRFEHTYKSPKANSSKLASASKPAVDGNKAKVNPNTTFKTQGVGDELDSSITDRKLTAQQEKASRILKRNLEARREDIAERVRSKLPIWGHRADIRWALRKKDVLLLIAETGSGKSTQVPQFLCDEPWCTKQAFQVEGSQKKDVVGGIIAITQPRKLAALTLARRVALEMGFRFTTEDEMKICEVGHSVRFDHSTPPNMKIKFLTEGMLLRELLEDPDLKQYSAVLVDEIHERSMDVDLLTGFLKKIVMGDKKGRHGIPLKVVIMSATAEMNIVRDFFNAGLDTRRSSRTSTSSSWAGFSDDVKLGGDDNDSIVEEYRVPGRQHQVTNYYIPGPVSDYFDAMVRTIYKIHTTKEWPGDILCFLPGQNEIEAVEKLIDTIMPKYDEKLIPKHQVHTLYGQKDSASQRAIFNAQRKSRERVRRVILSTNIAETSVTIPHVKYVVDCGKAKIKQYRHKVGIESLLVKPISKSSAKQRAGRAGRESAGECYRMYTERQYLKLADSDVPEILRADVIDAVLSMKARGVKDPLTFPLIDPPERDAVAKALMQLLTLGAISTDNSITQVGKMIARFPLSPAYGRILVAAATEGYNCVLEAIDVIACLNTEGEIFRQPSSEKDREDTQSARDSLTRREGDILTLLSTIQRCLTEAKEPVIEAQEPEGRKTWCEKHQVSWPSMKQAILIRRQLQDICVKQEILSKEQLKITEFEPITEEKGEALLKCFLKAFAEKTAVLHPDKSYRTTGTRDVIAIHPGSVMHGRKCEAIMYLEPVFTSKYFAKKVSMVQLDWVMDALAARQC